MINRMLRNVVLVLTIGAAMQFHSQIVESSSLSDMVWPPNAFDRIISLGRQGVGQTSKLIGRSLDLVRPDRHLNMLLGSEVAGESENFTALHDHDPDRDRNVSEIIRSRGFEAEDHDVITRDGYILTIQRIINPEIEPEVRANMKPVIIQHGLMSSSVDFVINSVNVKPEVWPRKTSFANKERNSEDDIANEENSIDDPALLDTQEHPNALGFYLANRGYDVFLTNSRGNYYGQRHVKMSIFDPKFWAFSFDEQIKYDLPDTIRYVQKLTNKTKLGYIGHSQGTLMMFGLMSERPEYADIVEPFVALAPVAYVSNCLSPVKYFSYLTPFMQHLNSVFAPPNFIIKYLGPVVCGPKLIKEEICANIIFLSCGFDMEELDLDRADAYLGHMPSGTSAKNIAHYGQMVNSGRFAHFDHGILANQMKYNRTKPPDYDLTKIRSKSIALFIASNDWLASPKDVARLRADLTVKPYEVFNITEIKPQWNHVDFVYAKHAGEIINTRIEQVFRAFDK